MKTNESSFKKGAAVVVVLGFFAAVLVVLAPAANADLKNMKAYKALYPEVAPKCGSCHSVAMPKKENGVETLNDYAKAVYAEIEAGVKGGKDEAVATEEAYKKIGKIEDFVVPAATTTP